MLPVFQTFILKEKEKNYNRKYYQHNVGLNLACLYSSENQTEKST